jgi:hypothetical protein
MKVAAGHRFETQETVQSKQHRSDDVNKNQGASEFTDTVLKAAGDEELFEHLARRVGILHLRQRLGLESDHHAVILGKNRKRFYIENWHASPWIIRRALQLTFLYNRARRNALRIRLLHNVVPVRDLPVAFEGFKILHLSDLHADMNEEFAEVLCQRIAGLDYDICVLTGDYRYRTYGPAEPALHSLAQIRTAIERPIRHAPESASRPRPNRGAPAWAPSEHPSRRRRP